MLTLHSNEKYHATRKNVIGNYYSEFPIILNLWQNKKFLNDFMT